MNTLAHVLCSTGPMKHSLVNWPDLPNRSKHWQHRQNLIWLLFPFWVPSTISVETFLAWSGTHSTMRHDASRLPSRRFRKSNFTKVPSGMLQWDKEASGRLASNLGTEVDVNNLNSASTKIKALFNSTWNDIPLIYSDVNNSVCNCHYVIITSSFIYIFFLKQSRT